MKKCILFDRDGTLGELKDKRFPESFTPFCDIKEVFEKIKARGYLVGLISNQSSIARGTAGDYDFDEEFRSYGADIWAICPHDTPDQCNCRKPKSGLLIQIAKKLTLPFENFTVVGDRISDVLCAKNVGANAAIVLTGYGQNEAPQAKKEFPDLTVLTRFDDILKLL